MKNNKNANFEILPHSAPIFAAAAGILAASAFACLTLIDNAKLLEVPIFISGLSAIFATILYVDSIRIPNLFFFARLLFIISALVLVFALIFYLCIMKHWLQIAITSGYVFFCFYLWYKGIRNHM